MSEPIAPPPVSHDGVKPEPKRWRGFTLKQWVIMLGVVYVVLQLWEWR